LKSVARIPNKGLRGSEPSMTDEQKYYRLVPDPNAGGQKSESEPPAAPPVGTPKIEAPGLLEGFEEDADFETDPEVDLIKVGPSAAATAVQLPSDTRPTFVRPGFGEPKHWAIAGAVLLVGAMIAAGVNAPAGGGGLQIAYRVALALYETMIHTGTGVFALYLASKLVDNRFGEVELAASRMFAAVSAVAFLLHLKLSFFGGRFQQIDQIIVLLLAIGGYVLIVATSFKLWDRTRLFYVVGFHAIFWLVVKMGMALQGLVAAASVAKAV
jgi:hypothetical protein